MSTVFGVLQHQGKINIADTAPITEWKKDARKNITINDLLHMNSGLEWDENYNEISDVTKMLFLEKNMQNNRQKSNLLAKPMKLGTTLLERVIYYLGLLGRNLINIKTI